MGELDVDLEVGIEFEPVCFGGFGGDDQAEKVGTNGLVANGLRVSEQEGHQNEIQFVLGGASNSNGQAI